MTSTSGTSTLKTVKTGRFSVLGLPSEKDAEPSLPPTTADNEEQKSEPKKQQQQQKQNNNSNSNKKNKGGGGGGGKQTAAPPKKKEVRPWTDELQADYDRIFSVGEECISGPELKTLLLNKGRGSENGFNLYDGFEPSGRMHIAQGVFKAMNVNKCTAEGTNATFVFWVADWFALMNDKMGGDLEKIRVVGQYLQEVWKAAGMDLSHVQFKWASEEITRSASEYWPRMLDVARRFTVSRLKKCCQIMGRLEGKLTAAQVLYPLMQCTDVFFLRADICQLGVDQRKVNMLAREYCDHANIKHKPVILSHHMLYGLKAGQEKMSKSDPDSAIFMEDSPDDVKRKITNAYCPSKEEEEEQETTTTTTEAAGETMSSNNDANDAGKESMHLTVDKLKNPCLDYIQHIIFSPPGATFTAASKTHTDFASVRDAFLSGSLSESDLKAGLIDALNELLEPVRNHFTNDARAKELLEKVRAYKKEEQTATSNVVRRLNLMEKGKVRAKSHLVFAPLPSAAPTLQQAVQILRQLARAPADAPCVLFLSDWSARVCNACDADVKAIGAYYDVLVACLRALDAPLMDEERVRVVYQSEAILEDPSDYWISVINVGRHFPLQTVMGPNVADSRGVGVVISRLMRVADVAGVEPASLSLPNDEDDDALLGDLVTQFFPAKLPGVAVPDIVVAQSDADAAATPSPVLNIRLQPPRASEALATEQDEYFLLDDPKVHGKSKMKKSFCEPGNITFCPPIALAAAFCFDDRGGDEGSSSSLTVQRSAENGGNKEYKTVASLREDFASGALHPGDLKAAVTPVMVQVLEKLSAGIKANDKAAKATKVLKAFQKKMAKSKKK